MINSLSLIIPAFNEKDRLPKSLDQAIDYFKKHNIDFEIIVVDDASSDTTPEIVLQYSKTHPNIVLARNSKNMGKGFSVKQGVMLATKQWVLFSDADFSTPISELDKFSDFAKVYDIVIGSRALKESKIIDPQNIARELSGKAFNALARLLRLTDLKDTQCGFKLFKGAVAKIVFQKQTINGFGFDVETLSIAKRMEFKIKEVGVNWKNSKPTKLRIFIDPLLMFFDLFRIWLGQMQG